MSLFLKLQKRVTELEQEKQMMQDELDHKEELVLRSKAQVQDAFLSPFLIGPQFELLEAYSFWLKH